jgi:soluble lytic murein transglycosylase-like protein
LVLFLVLRFRNVSSTGALVRHRRSVIVVAAVAALGLVLPAISVAQEAEELAAELSEAEDELSQAEGELAAALDRLARAEAELDAIDRRLAAAVGELARLEEELAEAEEAAEAAALAAEEAALAAEEAAVAAEEAAEELVVALEREAAAIARLEARAAEVYKRGTTVPQQFLVRGVAAADDWHQVALTLRAFDRVLGNDRDIVGEAMAARDAAVQAREHAEATKAEAETAHVEAEEAEIVAADELAEVEALLEAQEGAVAAAQAERRGRQAIFAELEEDAAVMAALTARLEDQVAQLTVAALAATIGPPPADGSAPAFSANLPAAGQPWAALIAEIAHTNGVDGRLMAALVWTESSFNPGAVSPAGAIGLAQLMPGTAAMLGVDPWVPEENLDGGSRYLRTQMDNFGSIELGLAAYNAGPGAVAYYGGIPPFAETQLYVVRVLERYQLLSG